MVSEIILLISFANFMQPILYIFYIQYVTMYSVIITKAIAEMHAVEQYKQSVF